MRTIAGLFERKQGVQVENDYLEGIIEDVVYADPTSGYTVCVLNCLGEAVTIVGIMPKVGEGESVRVQGRWTVHPSFGRQFRVDYLETQPPSSAEAILRYLASGAVRGIGPTLAQRIVDAFEEESLNVIEYHPEWLADIHGISPKKANEIHRVYTEQFGVRPVILAFGEILGIAASVRIFKRYGTNAVDLIRKNPYRLCEDLIGIRFEKADALGQQLGLSPSCPDRIRACIFHIINDAAYQSGHCKLPSDSLVSHTATMLQIPEEDVWPVVNSMEENGELIVTETEETRFDALLLYHQAEQYVASKALNLAKNRPLFRITGIDEKLSDLEAETGLIYDEDQREAIRTAATHGFTLLTGGPGTGKTTIVHALIQIFRELNLSCALAAPTGRAAKRMTEACGKEAKTIHRLLEAAPGEEGLLTFRRDGENPLACKVLIVDEMSMVDVLLMEALLRAVRPGTRVILIGDVDQLPPVGPGNCFSAFLNSGRFPAMRLTKIHRQAEQSLIITNAHRINNGDLPDISRKDSDFFFLQRPDGDQTREAILSLCSDRLPARYQIDPMKDIQVICITRKGPLGTIELNRSLQEVLNPPSPGKRERKVGSKTFRESDKVMQIRNNYDLIWQKGAEDGEGIFNGDIGVIESINPQGEYMRINFDGRICDYDFTLLEDLELAYAITTHKSQGSEYRFVLIPSFRAPKPLMTRNLLYTAVTRAKEMVCLIGFPSVLSDMIQNNRIPIRYSSLPDLLEAGK